MAERTTIIGIKVNDEAAIKSLTDLTEAMEQNRAKISDLKKDIKSLSEEEGDNTEAIRKKKEEINALNEQNKTYSSEARQISSEIQNNMKQEAAAAKEQEGSLVSLRAQLGNLTKEYDNLSKTEREGAKGQELKNKINETTDAIKEGEEATQRYQRNVGNYENAIKSALSAQSGFAGGLIEIATTSGGVAGAMKTAGQAVLGFGKQLLGLLANPIVALIAAIALAVKGVVDAFKSSEEQTQGLKKALAPLSAVLDIVQLAFQKLAAVVVKVVEGLMSAVNWITRNVASLFGMEAAYTAVNAVAEKYAELQEREYELAKKTREAQVQDAQDELKVSELRVKAKDKETQTDEERLAALMEANAIEEGIAKRRKELAEEAYEIAAGKAALTENNKETNDELARLEAEKFKAEKDYNDKRRALLREENAIRKEIADERKKAADDERKYAEDTAKIYEQAQSQMTNLIADNVTKSRRIEEDAHQKTVDGLTKVMDEVDVSTQQGLDRFNAYSAQLEAENQRHQQAMADIDRTAAEEEVTRRADVIQRRLELAKKNSDEEYQLKAEALQTAMEQELANEALTEEQKTLIREQFQQQEDALRTERNQYLADQAELEFQNSIAEMKLRNEETDAIELQHLEERLQTMQQLEEESDAEFRARQLEAQQEYLNKKKEVADKEVKIEEAKTKSLTTLSRGLQNVMDAFAGENEELAKASKVIALAQIAVETGVALAKGIAQAQSVPFPANIAAIATTVATILANIASAKKTIDSAKFASGGLVSGRGTSTSDSIDARLSDGEVVINAKSARKFRNVLNAVNTDGGGVEIPHSGRLTAAERSLLGRSRFAAGGLAASIGGLTRSMSVPVANEGTRDAAVRIGGITAEEMREVLLEMPSPVVSVEEVTDVQNRVKTIEVNSILTTRRR